MHVIGSGSFAQFALLEWVRLGTVCRLSCNLSIVTMFDDDIIHVGSGMCIIDAATHSEPQRAFSTRLQSSSPRRSEWDQSVGSGEDLVGQRLLSTEVDICRQSTRQTDWTPHLPCNRPSAGY